MSVPLAFEWRHLLFANWPVDADRLADHLPEPLTVQKHGGAGWLSVIPFVNVDTRLRGLPEQLGVDLPELNLRTYVTCDGEPGVYFFSLDAASAAAVVGARLTHRLPYYYARMSMEIGDGEVRFRSRRLHPGDRPARYEATYRPTGDPFAPEPGSLAEFLTERRRLYTEAQDGSVRYTDVSHERWTLYDATVETAENTLFRANGFARPEEEPVCFYSPGVSVVTSRSKKRDRQR